MRKFEIKTELDYLVARVQAETDVARQLLTEARDRGDYFREKAAAKLAAFCEAEEKLATLYAEIKSYYPALTASLEKRRPHLTAWLAAAKESWLRPLTN